MLERWIWGVPNQTTLVTWMVQNLPARQETQVRSLGWEDPLEKAMATHSSILAWMIPRSEEPRRLQSTGSHRAEHDWVTNTHNQATARMGMHDPGRLALPPPQPCLSGGSLRLTAPATLASFPVLETHKLTLHPQP